MIKLQRFLFPGRRGVTRFATAGELLPMRIVMTADTIARHTFEPPGAQRRVGRTGIVTFDTFDGSMFAGELKGGVLSVSKLQFLFRPAIGRVTLLTAGDELRVVRVAMAVRAFVRF